MECTYYNTISILLQFILVSKTKLRGTPKQAIDIIVYFPKSLRHSFAEE
jgi:hypothetical protein